MKKDPLEYLTEEQLDELLKCTDQPFHEKNKKEIKNKFVTKKNMFRKKRQQKRRWIIGGSTAALGLLLVGFTFRDDLSLAYKKRFGTDTEILLLNSDKLSQEVTDQGLRLKAVASFKDGNNQYLVSQLTDLTGDRLAKDTVIEDWEMFSGGNTQVVNYDEGTKTATLVTSAIGAEATPISGFQIRSFASQEKNFIKTFTPKWEEIVKPAKTWIDLTKQESQGGGFDEKEAKKLGVTWDEIIKEGLKPLEVNEKLDRNFTISNIAYKDNLLHVQLKIPNEPKMAAVFPSLAIGEKEIEPIVDFSIDEGTHNNQTGSSNYQEYVFAISEADLTQAKLLLNGWNWGVYQEGNWLIQLKEAKELPITNLPDQEIDGATDKVFLENITLSPLALDFDYTGSLINVPIILTYKDGTTFRLDEDRSHFQEGKKMHSRYEFGLKDNEEIQSIKIGASELSLDSKDSATSEEK